MVRVPGSSVDAGFHRESHEDEEKTTVMMDEGTSKTLEPGSPVFKKYEGSDDRQTLGGALSLRSKWNMKMSKKNYKTLPHLSS